MIIKEFIHMDTGHYITLCEECLDKRKDRDLEYNDDCVAGAKCADCGEPKPGMLGIPDSAWEWFDRKHTERKERK